MAVKLSMANGLAPFMIHYIIPWGGFFQDLRLYPQHLNRVMPAEVGIKKGFDSGQSLFYTRINRQQKT